MLFNSNNTFPDLISSVLISALLLISIIDIAPTKPIATPIILVFTTLEPSFSCRPQKTCLFLSVQLDDQ